MGMQEGMHVGLSILKSEVRVGSGLGELSVGSADAACACWLDC